ncbi:phage tail protein [Paenibacillus sp. GCM10023252]|uniref:phage tail protein n=1 Tax=Paenibacillus sp. GCM10023252 TaxID=3252649 RepID=UPI003613F1A8
MSEAYVGEIRMFGGNYAPQGWALCDGRLLNISDNDVLYTLLGTTFGGDGMTTFGLPDLRGRIPVHPGPSIVQGQQGGSETVTLLTTQLAAHSHTVRATAAQGNTQDPSEQLWAGSTLSNYADGSSGSQVAMNSSAITVTGGNQPHDNMMPSVGISFIIALQGVYPQQS